MVLFLYGPDSLSRLRRARELLSAYLAKNPGADSLRVDLAEDAETWKKAADFLHQPSMFADKKFLWVDSATEPEPAAWRKLLKEFLEDEKVFILLTEDREPRKDFKFLLTAPAKAESFPELEGESLKKFILREAQKVNLKLDAAATQTILQKTSGSHAAWKAAALVAQLAAVGTADLATVNSLVETNIQEVPISAARFAAAGALSAGRLEALEYGVLSGDPAYLFNSLAFRLRGRELIELADLDADIKLGGLEYEEALLKIALG